MQSTGTQGMVQNLVEGMTSTSAATPTVTLIHTPTWVRTVITHYTVE